MRALNANTKFKMTLNQHWIWKRKYFFLMIEISLLNSFLCKTDCGDNYENKYFLHWDWLKTLLSVFWSSSKSFLFCLANFFPKPCAKAKDVWKRSQNWIKNAFIEARINQKLTIFWAIFVILRCSLLIWD